MPDKQKLTRELVRASKNMKKINNINMRVKALRKKYARMALKK